MSETATPAPSGFKPRHLSDLPLWRLLVALDDAEQTLGPDSPTTRTRARHVQERLRQSRDAEEATRAS
jgi:hypothetical protein